MSSTAPPPDDRVDAVLVCGLGQLGVACIKALVSYGVPVLALDQEAPDETLHGLEQLTRGDFRRPGTLRKAGLLRCRSVLFLAEDAEVNMQGALAARHLSEHVRVVVRSHEKARYATLERQLGDFVSYVPQELAAASFALAALDSEVVAHFTVRGRLYQVIEHLVTADDAKLGVPVITLENADMRILLHAGANEARSPNAPLALQRWEPTRPLAEGDRLYLLMSARSPPRESIPAGVVGRRRASLRSLWRRFLRAATVALRPSEQEGKVALAGAVALLTLSLLAFVAIMIYVPNTGVLESVRTSLLILMASGHLADAFSDYETLPAGLRWAELLLSGASTLLTAVLFAVVTNWLLAARFALLSGRPKAPAGGHVVIAGFGRTGQHTARFLATLKRPTVALDEAEIGARVMPELPVVHGSADGVEGLTAASIASAVGLVAATGVDLLNVEIALLARSLNPRCGLVVRLVDERLVPSVATLVPRAHVLCIAQLTATAFAAAALGENVRNVFHLAQSPVLVTQYRVRSGDSLHERLLWEVAEGYGVVPIALRRAGGAVLTTFEDSMVRLGEDDRLVVLAAPASLEAIERGQSAPRAAIIHLDRVLPFAEELQVVGVITRNLGYTIMQARTLLRAAPIALPEPVYPIHAQRVARLLHSSGVQASVRPADATTGLA